MFSGAVAILREAATNGARKSINQNVSNLRTEVELEEEGGQSKNGSGHDQGVVEHVKHWAIKFATCSHVHSWAEAGVAMMGPLLPFNRCYFAKGNRRGRQKNREWKQKTISSCASCHVPRLITPYHRVSARATQPNRETRQMWHVLNLIA